MKTISLQELRNIGVDTWSVKDNSVRGCHTETISNIKPGDMVVIDNYFTLVTEEENQPKQSTEFKNIRKASKEEHDRQTSEQLKSISELKTVEDNYYYYNLLTAKQRQKPTETQKALLIIKIKNLRGKRWKEIENQISRIEAAPDFLGCVLSVEWLPNRTWGSNPRATAKIHTTDGWTIFESRSISGCGFDKESSATAEVLNRSDSINKELYKVFEKELEKDSSATPHAVFGYGSGYGKRPYFEGGCGCSCLYEIFSTIGYKFEQVASGKMYNAYTVTKGQK